MKKLLLLLILASGFTFAQEYKSYSLTAFPQKIFKVYAFKEKKEGKFELRVQVPEKESYTQTFIQLSEKNYAKFVDMLKLSREKYIEWSKTAHENNVTELIKEIKKNERDILNYQNASFILNEKIYLDDMATISFYFAIAEGKNFLIIENPLDLKSSTNRYISVKGYRLGFVSVDEIDNFIEMLDLTKLKEFLDNNTNKENLFK